MNNSPLHTILLILVMIFLHTFWLQFGNTCYCNSVLQALYFCQPFRDKVLVYRQQQKSSKKESLLSCLCDLFYMIATQKKKVGKIAPKKFIAKLRKENGALVVWDAFLCLCFFASSSVSQEFLLVVFVELSFRNLLVILINHYLEWGKEN